jgi:hypothetical protein
VGEALRVSAQAPQQARPAFYALERGGWRDYVTLLHLPYTAWNVSYAAIGASLAAHLDWTRCALTLLAFFLAVGIGAHALDELQGRPLKTRIPDAVLVALAVVSIGGACALGLYFVAHDSPWLLAFIVTGVVIVVGYNLELAGLHTEWVLVLGVSSFAVLTGAFAQEERITPAAVIAAAAAAALALTQRRLSTFVRHLRRDADAVTAELVTASGVERLDRAQLIAPAEAALRLLSAMAVLLAVALLVNHL